MSNAVDRMLDRFAILYGPPNTDEPEAFIAEYHRTLANYHQSVIDRAADIVIDEQDRTFWPTPGKCRQAAREAAAKMEHERYHQLPPPASVSRPLLTEEQKIRADVLAHELRQTTQGWLMPESKPLPDVSKQKFENMQRASRNEVHIDWKRRASGERDE